MQIREMEVRLELADAKVRQAELTAAEHLHTAQIEAANFREASRLLNDMGDKYKHFETTMKESTEVVMFRLLHCTASLHLFSGIMHNTFDKLTSSSSSRRLKKCQRTAPNS